MDQDTVIVPLRVSREQRRLWKVDAARREISLQEMLMEKLVGGWGSVVAQEGSKATEKPFVEVVPGGVGDGSEIFTKPKKGLIKGHLRCGGCGGQLVDLAWSKGSFGTYLCEGCYGKRQ